MANLESKIALVTGASRGVGKGIAAGLGEAGATVYLTGRTVVEGQAAVSLSGDIYQAADEVQRLGGRAIPVRCDHSQDGEVKALFERIRDESGRLDILVNNVWGGYEFYNDGTEFWKEKGFWTVPISRWDSSFQSGVRAHYVASQLAVPLMIARGNGLIVNISSIGARQVDVGVAYSVAKAADDRMVVCMAHELRPYGVAVISLYPGLVRTEAVLKAGTYFDLSNSESPQFIGRVIAGLSGDPALMEKSGQVLVAAELALEYGITDVDDRQPHPISK
jgi:dehydrogenase/reductase SDR family member 1